MSAQTSDAVEHVLANAPAILATAIIAAAGYVGGNSVSEIVAVWLVVAAVAKLLEKTLGTMGADE